MSSFFSIAWYNPFLVLVIGLTAFFCYLGTGLLILRIIRAGFTAPWRQVIAVLLGIMSASLLVQVVAMAALASRPVIIAIGGACLVTGIAGFLAYHPFTFRTPFRFTRGWPLVPVILLLAALLANLLAAIAPSTKIDELYQYMTLPSRIISDHALRFYLMPWEGSILPHMLYPFALTPLHAIGFPDAGNVVSWALSAMMVWFGWRLAATAGKVSGWTVTMLACLVTGMYPVIWNVTGGSYSMGDLATSAAMLALMMHRDLMREAGPGKFAFAVSFLVLCSAASKVTMLPACAVILVLSAVFIHREIRPARGETIRIAMAFILPWIIFYLPILVWTFLESGSPFGPLFAGFPGFRSVYDTEVIRTLQAVNREVNLPSLLTVAENVAIYFPALFWIVPFLFAADRQLSANVRIAGIFILLLHTFILAFVVIFDPRYYNGLIHGLLIMWLVSMQKNEWKIAGKLKKYVAAGSLMVLGPWLGIQLFYAVQFFPVALGTGDRMDFYREKVAFTEDYLALDRLLPADAVLVVRGENETRLDIAYAPRPVYLSMDFPPRGKKIFYFCISQAWQKPAGGLDSLVYSNDRAVITTYRNPFRPPVTGRLAVYAAKRIEPTQKP